MSQVQRFEYIQSKLAEARATGNAKARRMWQTKLNKWQQEYGAYAPIGYTGKIAQL